MFGYVLPALDKLDEENRRRFQAAYCGLCHTLGKRYGLAARAFLNYDLTFLVMLLGKTCGLSQRRCIMHPIRRRPCACQCDALDTAADISVILLWWQLQDGIADHTFFRGAKYRVAAVFLRAAYKRAQTRQPRFDVQTQAHLMRLSQLEQENCSSLDRPADCFASLLAQIAECEPDRSRRRVLEQMLYHLGRWIYLVDAADDLEDDLRSGNYNPLALRYDLHDGVLTEESRRALASTLDQSVRQMAAAFELADFGEYSTIIESTVYHGLYLVGASVLNGTFHRRGGMGRG